MNHAFVTVFVPFLGGANTNEKNETVRREDTVDELLGRLGAPTSVADTCPQALDDVARRRLPRFVHFLSMLVLPEKDSLSAYLVIEVSADGPGAEVLPRLVDAMPGALRQAIQATGNEAPATDVGLLDYLERHRVDGGTRLFATPVLRFTGTPEMTVRRIIEERQLALRLRKIIEQMERENGGNRGRHKASALGMLREARSQIFTDVDLKWAFTSEPVPLLGASKPLLDLGKSLALAALRDYLWVLIPLPLLVLLYSRCFWHSGWDMVFLHFMMALLGEAAITALAFGAGYSMLRRREDNDVPYDVEPGKKQVEDIMGHENIVGVAQNHMAGVSILKPGLIRRVALRLALWLIAEFKTASSSPGFLDKIGTIHFARWILIPNSDRLVFLSNYDGSWQSYLEDFIARLREGLTSLWSNTRDFPKTASLFLGGAQDGARFKRWARRQQVPTRFWYSAYPQLTTDRIRANAAIRHGFASASTEVEAAKWLALFGYAAPENVEKNEVCSLVFGSMTSFRFAHCLIVQFGDEPNAQKWLRCVKGGLSFGEHAVLKHRAFVAAFTANGLRMLAQDEAALATFPTAFQEGMSAPQRARTLGDEQPGGWQWGAEKGPAVHAVLMLFAIKNSMLKKRISDRKRQLTACGHRILKEVPLKELVKKNRTTGARVMREPFGFRDGISQPIMRGTKQWSMPQNEIHVVAPGELLLGYRDNLGNTSPSPSSRGEDIGRNGTFLVIRQLEQDKDSFDKFVANAARNLEGDPRVSGRSGADLEHWVAASMMGRWRDGSSLVRNPHPPPAGAMPPVPDNDFRFGREDPYGLRCPLGAHIRRANPRDSFEPDSAVQLAINNRHRILRVGRPYAPQGGQKPGLFFMCINADIERQFEFLQQTWLLGSNFHGLDNEIDPIVGYRNHNDTMTVPTSRGPVRLQGLAKFVSMLGGGYFFIPGKNATRLLAGQTGYGNP